MVQRAGCLPAHNAGLEALDLADDEVMHHLRRRAAVAHAVPHLHAQARDCKPEVQHGTWFEQCAMLEQRETMTVLLLGGLHQPLPCSKSFVRQLSTRTQGMRSGRHHSMASMMRSRVLCLNRLTSTSACMFTCASMRAQAVSIAAR